MYKYSCRKCPIRNRCIGESANADSIKVMIRRAFEARTDTLATWGRLQKNCLLVKAEQEQKTKTTPLSLRLQQVRESKETSTEKTPDESPQKKVTLRRLQPAKDQSPQPQMPDYLQPVPRQPKRPTRPLKRLPGSRPFGDTEEQKICWVTIENTRRHITLPDNGGLIFGRFDPNVGIPPDIDLAYEDRETQLVSRRHASIFGNNKQHTVEDLGSKSGIYLNGEKISYGPSRPLEPGDSIRIGSIKLIYDRVSSSVLKQAKVAQTRHLLYVTPTGRKVTLTSNKNAVIGRKDTRVNFIPEIDLSLDGDVTRLVSRRHALIQWRDGQPYLEDLGSGFGTKLRGDLLSLGQSRLLTPGDHIWLAGCVLAYDIES